MKLEEAIEHLNESLNDPNRDWGCEECKQEHVQLLEWLVELKERRTAEVKPVRWIPVEEQMPEEMDEVLLRFEESRAVGFYSDGSWCVITGNGFYTELAEDEDHPNAWMPLPELLNSEGTTRKEQEHNG